MCVWAQGIKDCLKSCAYKVRHFSSCQELLWDTSLPLVTIYHEDVRCLCSLGLKAPGLGSSSYCISPKALLSDHICALQHQAVCSAGKHNAAALLNFHEVYQICRISRMGPTGKLSYCLQHLSSSRWCCWYFAFCCYSTAVAIYLISTAKISLFD